MEENTIPQTPIVASLSEDLAKQKIAKIFGMDRVEEQEEDLKLSEILSWARKDSSNMDDIIDRLLDLRANVSTPSFGEKPINHFHRYIYLLMEQDKIKERLSKMENGNIK